MITKILFLDRDGTLIRHVPYLCDDSRVEVEEGVIDALLMAQSDGFELIVVTNQSSIARGICTQSQVERVNSRMSEIFRESGVFFSGIFVCPHSPVDKCDCRKPKTGLVREYLNNKPDKSILFVVGDQISDMEFGDNLEATCILYGGDKQQKRSTEAYISCSSWIEIGELLIERK